jgi:photosystem II stability/assembly factor-like uncharacterized protein
LQKDLSTLTKMIENETGNERIRQTSYERQGAGRLFLLSHMLGLFLLMPFMVGVVLAHSPHDIVDVLAVSPGFDQDGTIFVGNTSHLLRSQDGGYEWNELSDGLDNQTYFSAVEISPDFVTDRTVFVSTFGDGIYRSTDRGNSWHKASAGLPGGQVTGLAISPDYSVDGVVLAIVEGEGLFRSESRGRNWRRVLAAGVESVAISQSVSSKLAVAGGAAGRLYRSTDGGDTWKVVGKSDVDGVVTAIAIAAGEPPARDVVFIGTESGTLYRSDDAGERFERVRDGFGDKAAPIVAVSVSPEYANDHTVIVSTWEEAAFISADGGAEWEKRSSGLTTDPQSNSAKYKSPSFREAVFSGAYGRDRTIFLAGFDGLFVSTDVGQSWQQAEILPVRLIKALATEDAGDGKVVIGLGTYGGGAYFSEDGGDTWVVGNRGLTRTRLSKLTFSDNFAEDRTIYSGAYGKLLKSVDGGESWTATGHGEEKDFVYDAKSFLSKVLRKLGMDSLNDAWFPAHTFQDPYPTVVAVAPDGKTLFFGTRWHGIYRSGDAGRTSTLLWDAEYHAVTGLYLSPDFSNDQTLFATVRTLGVAKSTDAGESWTLANIGLDPVNAWREQTEAHRTAMDVELAMPDNFDKTGWLAAGTTAGLYFSTDGGGTWKNSGASEVNGSIEAIAVSPEFEKTRTIAVSVKGKGLFISSDSGETFDRPSGIPIDRIRYLAFSKRYPRDHTLYAASDENLYRSVDGGARWSLVSRPVRYENTREPVRFTGTWSRQEGDAFSGLNATWSDSPGDRADLNFVGTGVAWIGNSGPESGRAEVTIDDTLVETVDLYGEKNGVREVFRNGGLPYGPHTIAVVVSGDRNPLSTGSRVSIDAFDIAP